MDETLKKQQDNFKYETPIFDVIKFDYSDIIRTSGCTSVICAQDDQANFWL